MLPFEEALALLLQHAVSLGAERVGVSEALGRVLSEDVAATSPAPAFDQSTMDGYALSVATLAGDGPFELPVRGESAAGGSARALEPGAACRIFTGALLPEGADAVVPQENVERRGDTVTLRSAPPRGAFIRRRGDDLAEGAVPLRRGDRLHPGRCALAASLDRPHLFVARRPVVTVLCSGDELRLPGEPGAEGSVAESNGTFVAAAGRAAGALVRIAPFMRDDADETTAAVQAALRGSDVVITVGGVSVGDRDFVRPALEAAGARLEFVRVAMKPGKPLVLGRAGEAVVLGLPGNPVSASLTFLLFGVPLLRALQGDRHPVAPRERMPVKGALRRAPGRTEFLRARLERDGGQVRARLLANQASGAVTSLAEADALVVVPREQAAVEDGERLETIRLSEI